MRSAPPRCRTPRCETSPKPEMKSGIRRFLLAMDEIEDDTKAVLGILAAALGAP